MGLQSLGPLLVAREPLGTAALLGEALLGTSPLGPASPWMGASSSLALMRIDQRIGSVGALTMRADVTFRLSRFGSAVLA